MPQPKQRSTFFPPRAFLLAAMLMVLGCSATPEPDAGAGGGRGGGTGGGGQAALDAGKREGEACASSADCASGLQCVSRVEPSGVRSVCSACQRAGTSCGDGGRCLAVVQSSGTTVVCSFGATGEPCSAPADCLSGFCDSVVIAAGVTTSCR